MTCYSAQGGTLRPPVEKPQKSKREAVTRCKACGGTCPTKVILSAHGWTWDQHARVCPSRPLDVSLGNLARFAELPPGEYIVDQELALIKRRIIR